ncbi:MAG: RND transporter [Fimbriimonadales bacterium]|nr:MAG: RND transporter [Fimbriimonadales bacterium]
MRREAPSQEQSFQLSKLVRPCAAAPVIGLFALVIFAANLCVARAAPAEPLTLQQAIALARQNNPELLAVRQEAEVARGRVVKARYWNPFNPEIEGGAAQRRFDDGGSDAQRTGGVSLEIEVGGQRAKRIEEAQRNLARVQAEIADTERLILARVKEAYYEAVYLQRRLQLFRQVEDLNRRLRDASAERFRSGEVPKLEANLGVVRYSQARKDTLAADRDYRNAVRELERLLGREPLGTVELAGDFSLRPIATTVESLVETALRLRQDLHARDAEIQRVEAEISLTKRSIVPNLTLRGTYDEETESAGMRDRIVGGRISIPLPLFDRRQAELTALAGQRAQVGYKRSATLLTIEAEVRNAYRSYEAAAEALQVFEADTLSNIAESFGFIETAYREGKIGLLQLVVVQNDLVNAQFSYLDSLRDYWLARTALERAVGQELE